jgi:hypothetical protein
MENASEPRSHRAEGKQQGSCHCGAVRFEVSLEPGSKASRCNCSICTKLSLTGFIVKPEAFRLLTSEAELLHYEFGHKVSKRFFCRHCGVHCYGSGFLAEIGGDFVSVNGNCLDDLEPTTLDVIYWDGRHNNWQAGPSDRPWRVHV